MSSSSRKPILAVDIGGTKVAAGVFSPTGKILASSRGPMIANGSAGDGLRAVFDAIDPILNDSKAKRALRIGISVPGWVDFHGGKVVKAANLPCWRDYPLAARISRHYGMRAFLANDADAAALAEAAWGAALGSNSAFYVSLGTGIGTGMVLNRKICLGRGGSAFEGGHMTINFDGPECPCGKRGCIEMYASGKSIARLARERLVGATAGDSRILALARGDNESITAETVDKAARENDQVAVELFQDAADYLAIWLGNIIDLLEPEIIVFGGGLGRKFIRLLPRIRKQLDRWSINPRHRRVRIAGARFGSDSALYGAAALCLSAK